MTRLVRLRLLLPDCLALLGLVLLLVLTWQPTDIANAAPPMPGDPAVMLPLTAEQSLFDLTNADRIANGVAPLMADPDTLSIARLRAMSQLGKALLTHYDVDGSLAFVHLLASASIGYELAGENLARADDSDATMTKRIEQALMNSPLHRKNILETGFTRLAIGMATGASGQIAFAEIYRN